MFRGKKKILVVGSIVGGIALTAGAAFALWTANGSGPGSAKAISAQGITVSASTPTADLFPGFTQGDLFFSLNNPNPYPVTFASMSPVSVTSLDTTNCPSSNVTVVPASSLAITVPANNSLTTSIANVVSMASTAGDGCQGVGFTINVTLSGSQS